MRIGYIIPGCDISGGIAVVCQHVNRLKRRGHDMYLISTEGVKPMDWFPDQSVPVVSLADCPEDLDILVATGWSTSFHAAALPAKRKFYFVQSDETRFHPPGSPWEHITRLSYRMDFEYLTMARWLREWLKQEHGHDAALVPNGLDPEIFHPAEPLSPKGGRPRVLLEGAIDISFKGMAEAFEAVRDLDVEVWCVSSQGRPRAGWRCDRSFEGVPAAEMKHIYSSCDILLKLSRVESFCMPPMEMMACGGVCVVGRVTGPDEYIIPEENALMVDTLDISGVRDAVSRLIDDKALRERLIKKGAETAALWRWEPSIDVLENTFREALRGQREGRPGTVEKTNRSIAYFYFTLVNHPASSLIHDEAFFINRLGGQGQPLVRTLGILMSLRRVPLINTISHFMYRRLPRLHGFVRGIKDRVLAALANRFSA